MTVTLSTSVIAAKAVRFGDRLLDEEGTPLVTQTPRAARRGNVTLVCGANSHTMEADAKVRVQRRVTRVVNHDANNWWSSDHRAEG